MYNLGQATYDWGYDSGMLNTLKSLVVEGLLSLCVAAEQAKMSEEMFIEKTTQKNKVRN